MTIQDTFYLQGFTRIDKDDGAVFLRYTEKADDRKPEIRETPLCYGGQDTLNFTLSVPKPRAKELTACAIVERSSKNCYSATAYNLHRIRTFRSDTATKLQKALTAFFKEA